MRTLALFVVVTLSSAAYAKAGGAPTLAEVMRTDLQRARIEWSKVVDGKRVVLSINGGYATRLNPAWAPGPAALKYDLGKNRALNALVKRAHHGAATKKPSELPADRTLAILADSREGFVVIGQWSRSLKAWKLSDAALVEHLEPLFDLQTEVFDTMKDKPAAE